MSQVCGAGMINPSDDVRIGTVGKPLPAVEARLADDGQLLVRGDPVMTRYHDDEEKTREAFTDGGWLLTGDLAAIDGDGYVRSVGRQKELILNGAGKNMSPTNIEAAIGSGSALIGPVMAVGDDRPYNVALVALEPDAAAARAGRHEHERASLADLAQDEGVRDEVERAIGEGSESSHGSIRPRSSPSCPARRSPAATSSRRRASCARPPSTTSTPSRAKRSTRADPAPQTS